jgi:methyl acetate hydrolase
MLDTPQVEKAIAASGLAGGVLMTGDRDGVTSCKTFGVRDVGVGDAMPEDALFQIASMTKAVVSVGALMLVEAGKLSLDAPLGDLLPDLANPQVIAGFAEDGSVETRPAARPITLKNLLTHTSGMGYDFMSADQLRARGPDGPPAPGSKALLLTPLLFDPGERWEYGISTDWVGLAIEAVTGERLDTWLEANVITPLGMADTCFFPTADLRTRQATLYARTPEGLAPMPIEFGAGEATEIVSAGGGLYSTAGDYMRFMRMILNGGALDGVRLLGADSMGLLTQNLIGDLRAGEMGSTMPMLALPFDPFPGVHTGWSAGFMVYPETGANGRSPGTLSWAGVANCFYWIDPAKGIAAVMLSQLLPFGDPAAVGLFEAFERSVYGLE